jgi:nucleotide-binding universal stress UspA family protein
VLGEAYAFGLIWSFVFQAISMVVLRFRDRRPREFKVPFNIQIGSVQVPLGLSLIMFILVVTAIMNLLTKEVATVAGTAFTIAFFTIFWLSERFHEKRRRGNAHQHLEQFNQQATSKVTVSSLSLTKIYRKLVAIRSPHNLFMLEKALAETDPDTTAVVVMTAKVTPTAEGNLERLNLDLYDQQLMTAVVQRAEKAGKQVRPLIVPTNNPLYAVLQTARDLQAQELIIGASNKYTADEQQDQIALYWFNLHQGQPAPLTVRILSRDRDISFDLAGGNRIPKISERRARSVAELRAAGVGVDRVLLVHDGSPAGSDLFQAVLTMLDPEVALGVVPMLVSAQTDQADGSIIAKDQERAQHLDRSIHILAVEGENGAALVRLAREGQYDLIILGLPPEPPAGATSRIDARVQYVLEHAHCRVFLAAAPVIPAEVIDTSPGKDEG